ncbi:MAG TPA: glycosyltransferase, partial [Jatrophihabitans sp.]
MSRPALRISIVGPTHPIKGGVSQHTTVLAQQLVAQGREVEIVSWLHQYPARLYPGQQTVDQPEFTPFEPTRRTMSWNRPDSWIRAARSIRDRDLVIFAHITPVQVPAYRAMLGIVRRGKARTVVICHNVLPHEQARTDRAMVSSLLRAPDAILVHSDEQAAIAASLTSVPIAVATMAPFMPDGFVARQPIPGVHRRVLFFGLVRPYKGLDLLLHALARVQERIELRVAGEFWGGPDATSALIEELGLTDLVEIRSGYLPAEEVPGLFADVDALVLPYRSATGSQGVWTGFEFGVPVIASDAGHLADDIRPGVDGLICSAGSVESLTAAIDELYENDNALRMRAEVRPVDPEPIWQRYLQAVLDDRQKGEAMTQKAAPPGGRLLHAAKLAAEQVLWARVAARSTLDQRRGKRRPLPTPVPPTDVLGTTAEYEASVAECKRLGLPPHRDKAKNWDALGAVSTVLNDLGTDIRVLDAGAARYSSILPWLRLYQVRELVGNNLEFTKVTRHGTVRFEPGDVTNTHYKDGWFDAVTCMSVIEHGVPLQGFVDESARIIRPGGLLIVSTDYDQDPPDTTGKFAYGVQVKIFSPRAIN